MVNAIWDTGSSRFLVETDSCENCIANVYDTQDSSTFNLVEPYEQVEVTYGDGTALRGYYATDSVCPSQDDMSCIDEFKFVALYEQSGLQINYDGIMGMWNGANGR